MRAFREAAHALRPVRDHVGAMARTITLLPLDLPRRFAAAAGHEPLSALSPRDRGELAVLLAAGARDLEDLPGRWQAALLASEAAAAGMTPASARSCCSGGDQGGSARARRSTSIGMEGDGGGCR